MALYKSFLFLFIFSLFSACATYNTSQVKESISEISLSGTNIYLIGDAGYYENGNTSEALIALNDRIKTSKTADVLLFLGDNIYPKGMPVSKQDANRIAAEESLQAQLKVAENFKGKVIFIPGNHDWYTGIDGLHEQEKMVENALGKNSFLPEQGCPLDSYKVSENITIITVDSEWYITDWDKHPKINDNCEIKTRKKFMEEFKSLVNKNQGKTILLAIHHPLFSNGNHGGQYAFNQYGLPVLNIPVNIIRRASGVSPADLNFPLYRELSNKITTILQEYKNDVIVVSGHDHNLQYLVHHNIPQIISGSGSKANPVRQFKKDTTNFGYPGLGYAILNIQNNKQQVSFFNAKNQVIQTKIIRTENSRNKDTNMTENALATHTNDFSTKVKVFVGDSINHTLTDDYEINTYNYLKGKKNLTQFFPTVGYNPDEGFQLGVKTEISINNFRRNPFSQKHIFEAKYFTETKGFEVRYQTEIAQVIGDLNLGFETLYTTPAFSQNFFGFGNETLNLEDDFNIEYYRTRLEQFNAKLSLIRRGKTGSLWNFSIPFQHIKPNENDNRFVEESFTSEQLAAKKFMGIESSYSYINKNNAAFSTLGIEFNITAGWKTNLEDTDQNYAYFSPLLQLDYPIIKNEILTLSTLWKANIRSNSNFEFYQAASIGGKDGLRGYRNERFSAKSSYYQNTDLRLQLFKFNAGLLPSKFGVFSGFDYGRVWSENDTSNQWHTSFGGGIFVNGAGILTLQSSYFTSEDGGRFMFGLGFGF